MEKINYDSDALNEVYRGAKTAISAINSIFNSITDEKFKEELIAERSDYEGILKDVTAYMNEKNYEPKDVSPLKKASMSLGIKINASMNDSTSKLAEMMIKGTVTGSSELMRLLTSKNKISDEKIIAFIERLKNTEEEYEKRLKTYL